MVLIAAVTVSSNPYVLLKRNPLKNPLQNTLVSHCIPGVKCAMSVLAISPNAGRIGYLHVVIQMPFLLLINANDYSSLTYNVKESTVDTTSSLPHHTPYVSLRHG